MKQRNHAFDFLCGICIIRMVSLHTMAFCGHADDPWWREVMQWSYYFMSFFFFKAGYFNKSVLGDTRAYCIDKAKRLLVPYLTAGLMGGILYFSFLPFLLHRYRKPIEPLAWEHIWKSGAFYGNNPTWFLVTFFTAYVAIHLLERLRQRLSLPLPSPVRPLTSVLYLAFPFVGYAMYRLGNPIWLGLNNVFMGIFFFELGRLWHLLIDRTPRLHLLRLSALLVAAFVASNAIFHDCAYTMSNNTFSGNPLVTVANISAVLCGLSGLLILLRLPRIPVVNFIGEHSMVFFLCHYPMLYYCKFVHLCFGRSIFGRYDEALLLLPAILALCAWIVPYFERLPWLSGRWPKQPRP